MSRPGMNSVLMEIAVVMARRGTCSRAQVGCVIARDDRVLATAYNGAPRGMPHCEHPDGVPSSARSIDAPACATSVHAEANAVAFAARYGIALNETTLYTTLAPCVTCAQLVVNAGIEAVFVRDRYRDPGGLALLARAGVTVLARVPGDVELGRPDEWTRVQAEVTNS